MSTLNAIVAGFPSDSAARAFEHTLRQLPIQKCFALCKYKNHIPELQNTEVEWLYPGMFDQLDWDTLLPLDESLIDEMRPCEVVFLEMMTRRETKGRQLSYLARKREYLRTLQYWNHILSTQNINFFLASDIPHTGMNYVLGALCKRLNIPTFYFHPQPLKGTLLLETDHKTPGEAMRDCYEQLSNKYEAGARLSVPLAERFEHYYQLHTTKKNDPTPWYMKLPRPGPLRQWYAMVTGVMIHSRKLFIKRAFAVFVRMWKVTFWKNTFAEWCVQRQAKHMFRFYDRNAADPDLTKKFVYVPLHYQPECTTCPMGGVFSNQLLLVQLLAASLPKNISVYVKEHPFQTHLCRDISFYKDLLRIPSVRLVPRGYSTFHLLDHCEAVATVTGKAGFEGLFRGKPVFLFGHVFYEYAPGVYRIRTEEDSMKAAQAIFHDRTCPKLPDMRLFLRAMQDTSIDGHVHPAHQVLSDEENIQSISTALLQSIQKRLSIPYSGEQ